MAVSDEQVKTVRIVIDASKAKEGAADVEKALKSIDNRIGSLGDVVGGVFTGLKSALLGMVSFDAIMTQIRGLTEAFDRLSTKAHTLGTTTDWLQAFEFALASSTVKIDEGYKALDKFARLVGEGAQGNKAAVDTLNQLGLKIYDINHQVRPVTDLFEEAARKLAGMKGAAEQNALAVESMGRTAQAVIPALEAIGQGSDAMIKAGEKAGAIVSSESVKIWEEISVAADKAMIKWRSFAGENFAASVKKVLEVIGAVASTTLDELKGIYNELKGIYDFVVDNFADEIKKGFEALTASVSIAIGMLKQFGDLFRALASEVKQFVNPDAATIVRRNLGMDQRQADIDNALKNVRRQDEVILKAEGAFKNRPTEANLRRRAEAEAIRDIEDQRYDLLKRRQADDAAQVINASVGSPDGLPPPVSRADFGPRPPPPASGTVGVYAAVASDHGARADRENKRIQALQAEADATRRMADAAKQGAAAVNEEEAEFKALQQALEVVGDKAKATDPKVQALKDTFKAFNQEIADNKAITAFRLQTEDIGRQNGVLQKRLDLMDAAPEVVAREIGQLHARNEAAKTGAKISEEDIAARGEMAEKQELLNQKMQQAQRLQELWLQPLKSALSSMQQGLAGLFEGLLSGGINSWQQFTDTMKKIWIRMIAELAAVSVIRPLIAPIIAGAQGLGLISPSVANQLGYPSAGGGSGGLGGGLGSLGSLGGSGGGLSSMTMPSWLGGGQPFRFLDQPIFGSGGPLQGTSPAAMEAPDGATGAPMGGVTWGQGLIALAGAGMGVYNLATSHSAGQTIGGIGSLIGAGVSLIPGIGQIAGPAISLLGGLLPGLFGDSKPEPPTMQATAALNFSGGQFVSSGGAYGGARDIDLGGVGTSMKALLDAAKVTLSSSSYGLMQQTYEKGSFSNATTFVTGPGGEQMQWGQSSNPAQQAHALDTAAAHVAHQIMMEAGSGISDLMREGLSNFGRENLNNAFSTKDLGNAIARLQGLEDAINSFGQTTTKATAAIKQIDSGFDALFNTAAAFKLSASEVGKIEAERDRKRLEYAKSFSDDIDQQVLQLKNPTAAAYAQVNKAMQDMLDNNATLVEKVAGYEDQKVKIEELAALKRQQIVDHFAQQQIAVVTGSVDKLEAVIRQLSPGGALSNLDPTAQLKGLQASAAASYAQALADPTNATLIERAAADAQAASEHELKYYAGSTGYTQLRDQRLTDLQQLQGAAVTAAAGTLPGQIAGNDQLAPLLTMMAQLIAAISQNTNDNSQRDADIARLMSQMTRLLARPAA